MMRNREERSAGIDYFRMAAAFMVIAIHISPFSGAQGPGVPGVSPEYPDLKRSGKSSPTAAHLRSFHIEP